VPPAATVNVIALALSATTFMDISGGTSAIKTTFLSQKILPTGLIPTGAAGKIDGVDVPFGGISGLAYDTANNRYYGISDDRSQFGAARFYTLNLDPNTLATTGVNITGVTTLKDTSGKTFGLNTLDPEGIAFTGKGTVFVASEGEVNPAADRVIDPFVKEFSLTTGQEVRSLVLPTKFLPKFTDTNQNGVIDSGDSQISGIRNNLAFESLTITPDQKTLYTATENALLQDGDKTTINSGSNNRIIQYNLTTGAAEKEYLYIADAIAKAPNPATPLADSGLVDLLAIDDRGTFLALERSFAAGQGITIKVYEVNIQGATDIRNIESLTALTANQLNAIAPTQKRLVLDLDTLKLPNSDGNHPNGTDNIEGISFGPKLADGRQSIVLVSDNNFGATQFTQVLSLGLDLNLIGTKSQGLAEGRMIDLTDYPGKSLKVDTTTQGDAVYNNNIGFYAIEDTSGMIKLANGSTLKPGDANYAIEAIKSAVLQAGKIDSKLNQDITGGKIYAPVVVAQGSLADFVSKNPTNGGDGKTIHAYFNYLGANPDKFDHFKLIGNNTFAVEDLYGGGDQDFNDLIVNMNIKIV
jgi:hypothetical protein